MSTPEIDFDEWDESQDALEAEAMDEDPKFAGLADTLDARDYTPDPPAMLPPLWVHRMQKRLAKFRETGNVDWMEREAA